MRMWLVVAVAIVGISVGAAAVATIGTAAYFRHQRKIRDQKDLERRAAVPVCVVIHVLPAAGGIAA